jgi:hypothetical protein
VVVAADIPLSKLASDRPSGRCRFLSDFLVFSLTCPKLSQRVFTVTSVIAINHPGAVELAFSLQNP